MFLQFFLLCLFLHFPNAASVFPCITLSFNIKASSVQEKKKTNLQTPFLSSPNELIMKLLHLSIACHLSNVFYKRSVLSTRKAFSLESVLMHASSTWTWAKLHSHTHTYIKIISLLNLNQMSYWCNFSQVVQVTSSLLLVSMYCM